MILDLILIVILLSSFAAGYRKGALYVLIGFLSFVLSVGVASTLSPRITNTVITAVQEKDATDTQSSDGFFNEAKQAFNETKDHIKDPNTQAVYDDVFEILKENKREPLKALKLIKERFSKSLANDKAMSFWRVIYASTFIIVLIIVNALLMVVVRGISNIFNAMPFLGFGNRLVGAVFSVFMTVVKIFFIVSLLLYTSIIPEGIVVTLTESSHLVPWLINNRVYDIAAGFMIGSFEKAWGLAKKAIAELP